MGRRNTQAAAEGSFPVAASAMASMIVPAVAFLLEVAMLASFFYWGFRHSEPLKYVLGIGIPAVVVVLWGLFMAPKSDRRLPEKIVTPVSLIAFIVGGLALLAADVRVLGIIMIAASVLWFVASWVFRPHQR